MKEIKLLSLVLVIAFSSCNKKGCIDENAINFDEDAKKDDGSCTYNPVAGEAHEGGFVAYVFKPEDIGYVDGEFHGLITTKIDQAMDNKWGCVDLETEAIGEAIGTGTTNSSLIVNACAQEDIAARICENFSHNGYDDWYLPSIDELNKLYENKDEIGGFASATYWSSTEYDKDLAWGQSFNIGSKNPLSKDNTFRVGAIRKF